LLKSLQEFLTLLQVVCKTCGMTVQTPADRPLFISIPEAARRIGVSYMTAHRAVSKNLWPAVQIGERLMIPTRWLDELVDSAFDGAA